MEKNIVNLAKYLLSKGIDSPLRIQKILLSAFNMSRTAVNPGETEMTGKTGTCPWGTYMKETDSKLVDK